MKALQYRTIGAPPEVVTVPDPEPGPGQVLLKVTAAGVCHSDIAVMSWPAEGFPYELPLTLGHEGVGTVAALGAGVTGLAEGDAVAVYGPWGCGTCAKCAEGKENYCLRAAGPSGVAGAVARAMERSAPGSGASWYGGDHTDFRDGVFLREVIGVQVVVQEGGAAFPEAMTGLPPRPGGFTGRDRETEDLLRALDPDGAQSAAAPVASVSGLGGIGKTALAVETAHLARERGWFP
ncbi:alcohol dehydrogenase catalytic domain-containing protein, partial [Streptomyces violaceoruber]